MVGGICYALGRIWSRFPFIEIWSVHLGHTIFESSYFLQHRPVLIFWKKPVANLWLVRKLETGVRFPALQGWFNHRLASGKRNLIIAAVSGKSKIRITRFEIPLS